MSKRRIRARVGWVWLEMGSWKRMSQQAMVPLLVPEQVEPGKVEKLRTETEATEFR